MNWGLPASTRCHPCETMSDERPSLGPPIELLAMEHIPARPFTDPALIGSHRAAMTSLVSDLCHLVESGGWTWVSDDEFPERLIVTRHATNRLARHIAVVGFFGRRRAGIDQSVVASVERLNTAMIEAFEEFPAMLAYASRRMADEVNFGNLVLLTDSSDIARWAGHEVHAVAVAELSPRFYDSVTIYNGLLPRGLTAPEQLALTRAKYWDFRVAPPWHAQRSLEA